MAPNYSRLDSLNVSAKKDIVQDSASMVIYLYKKTAWLKKFDREMSVFVRKKNNGLKHFNM